MLFEDTNLFVPARQTVLVLAVVPPSDDTSEGDHAYIGLAKRLLITYKNLLVYSKK